MAFIGRLFATPIGLAAEAYEHNKAKKEASSEGPSGLAPHESSTSARSGSRSPSSVDKDWLRREELQASSGHFGAPPAYSETRDDAKADYDYEEDEDSVQEEEDEADWARDETQAQLDVDHTPQQDLKEPSSVDKFVHKHCAAFPRNPAHSSRRLEVPVIIPQRRPETRERGFVRAYAPILEDCDVPQDAFLHFTDGFSAVVREQKWFWALNGAVAVTGIAMTASAAIPELITQLAFPAIHWTVEGGRRAYESNAVNRYLDKMNQDYFKPRGLYALVMTHDPYSSKKAQEVSLDNNMMKSIRARDDHHLNNLHQSSGHATELQIPESAPLVFPALEAASDEQKASAFKRAGAFARDYVDRRARSNFETSNPDSKLVDLQQAKPTYQAPIADPSHPMWHGGLITILSGGKIPSRRQRKRTRAEQGIADAKAGGYAPRRRDARTVARAERRQGHREMYRTARKKGYTPLGFVSRTLGQHVVYLMIVPYPTEREFAEYDHAMAREKAAKEGHAV